MADLYDTLKTYCNEEYYPFHMPGHKRRLGGLSDPFSFDITEIEGFDNLHHAEGILARAQQNAADLYGAEETHFLVNGSTCGILSAIGACAPSGRILMARNSHKAAYHAVLLNRLEAVYLYPKMRGEGVNGPILTGDVRQMLEADPQIRAVFITSPTYDGIVSDVEALAALAHQFGIPLIVDAAHGAHFGMHPDFPENAVRQGADIVIHSLHKTLPSLTQTALLHVNGERVDRSRLRRMLGMYQSSSPSYVLMASMDECVRLLQSKGKELFAVFTRELRGFRERMALLKNLRLLDTDDPSKILICGSGGGLSGLELAYILRERYHLEMEMAAESYVLALTAVGDAAEGFTRLARALEELDEELDSRQKWPAGANVLPDATGCLWGGKEPPEKRERRNEICMTIAEADQCGRRSLLLEESGGLISAEFIYLYPPGIPMIVPGERISEELLGELVAYRRRGYSLQGLEDYRMKNIQVIETEK